MNQLRIFAGVATVLFGVMTFAGVLLLIKLVRVKYAREGIDGGLSEWSKTDDMLGYVCCVMSAVGLVMCMAGIAVVFPL